MSRRSLSMLVVIVAVGWAAAALAQQAQQAQEDTGTLGPVFQEGDVISYEGLAALRPFLPPEFWAHREFFFFEGMRLEIGPFFRDYAPPPEYLEASRHFAGQARIGPDESLERYVAGQPFPMGEVDCENDPQAGVKIMWNFDYQWQGDGGKAMYLYTYWDRGEELPLFYEGSAKVVLLSARVEKEYLEKFQGDLFRGETRKSAFGIEVEAPFDARGIKLMTYRYKDSEKPRAQSKNDDTWVYLPQLRRVRRISLAQRADAVSGTDFTFDDLNSFAGIIPQYEWTCLGEMDLIAPVNSLIKGFPYSKENNFGPYGLSYANDRWELRHAVKVRMVPKDSDYPYSRKDLYLDKETLTALYSFAYDQQGELWKIIWHNHRWSEDDRDWYKGWQGVPSPRDLRVVSDTIANVQTGTGNRIEFWDNHGTPFKSRGRVRRYIDVGRLTKGRGSTKRFFVR